LHNRLQYYRRIFHAYFSPHSSQLAFWHETPEINPRATVDSLGEYYMSFEKKAQYARHLDHDGVPMLDYRGIIGLQHNPIAVAQWGLGKPTYKEIPLECGCGTITSIGTIVTP